uniref:5'-nucleotidase n=1 Tax=Acrobeloides nanus TaxID=290746 RepID=A0A914EJR3_9BILA
MDILSKYSHVHIAHPEKVKNKIQKIINDGKGKLLFISDFDYTLTRYTDVAGNICMTTRDLIRQMILHKHPEYSEK